jgi:lysophospholipase L1-like esterase
MIFSFTYLLQENQKIPMKLQQNALVIAYGDSITYGYNVDQNQSYPAVLSRKIGLKVINAGVPGEDSTHGLERLGGFLKKNPSLIILCHGANDILHQKSQKVLKENLLKMVKMAQNRGAQVLLVGVPDFTPLNLKVLPLYKDVAEKTGCMYEGEVITHIEGTEVLKSDLVHPNAQGYALMAEKFMEILRKNGILD